MKLAISADKLKLVPDDVTNPKDGTDRKGDECALRNGPEQRALKAEERELAGKEENIEAASAILRFPDQDSHLPWECMHICKLSRNCIPLSLEFPTDAFATPNER